MPCPDKKPVRSYLTAEEHERLSRMAASAGCSISQFMRDVCLGYEVPSFQYEEFKLELLKNRADLGRLGGLFKSALATPDRFTDDHKAMMRNLLSQISSRQKELQKAVERL